MNSLLRISTCACALVLVSCGGGTDMATLGAPRQAASVIQSAPPQQLTFPGNFSQYAVYDNGAGSFIVVDNIALAAQAVPAGTRLRFADTAIATDLEGVAGKAYRLYQAAFNRVPDLPGLGFQMNELEVNGLTLAQVAQNFVNSPEFSRTYGNVDNTQFVTLLYRNVLKREPEPAGLAFHLSYLNGTNPEGRVISRGEDLSGFSESPENKALVLPAIHNGIEYIPMGFTPPANAPAEFAGTYNGSIVAGDAGTLTITVAANGVVQGLFHSNSLNADLQGTGTLVQGGKFTMGLTGAGRNMSFSGSIQLSAGLATGFWQYVGGGGSGAFNASSRPAPPPPPPPPPPITYASRIGAIVMQRCVPCHSAHPTQPGFNPAPLGIMFDTEGQVRARADQIKSVAVDTQFMPYGNITGMTQAERNDLAAWFAAGQP